MGRGVNERPPAAAAAGRGAPAGNALLGGPLGSGTSSRSYRSQAV